MKECILFVSDINESCIQPLNNLFYGAQLNITYNKLASFLIFVEFYKLLVFKNSYATSVLSCTNN